MSVKCNKWYTYMIRCEDNSVYTGMTSDIERRMSEHFSQNKKAAKYTKRHTPKKLEALWTSSNKSLAASLEAHIKRLNKKEKEDLISGAELKKYLQGKIDLRRYRRKDV